MMEEVRCLDVEIEELWTQLTSATSNNDGMPKGTVQDRQTKLHAIMADKLQTKRSKKQVAEEIMAEVLETIDKVTDPNHRQLLFERYIQDKEWKDIADDIGYVEEYVRGELHGKALNDVRFLMD
jgi:DNA-directed RNA polymerase specialized sigma subunit